jgi:hypothetical protein
MRTFAPAALAALSLILTALPAPAQNAAVPGTIVQELPTLRCLGFRWLIGGDANANAVVLVEYRRTGDTEWRKGQSLFRVDRAGMRTLPPNGQVLHAGSIFDLDEDTAYEVRLSLEDPDGGLTERSFAVRTWLEPRRPVGGKTVAVKPGELAKALAAARPGDTLELQKGVYRGVFSPPKGTATSPITIVGPADRSAVLDGGGGSSVLNRTDMRFVILENLTVQNAKYGMAFNGGGHITVRRCTIRDVDYGFVAQRSGTKQQRILIADNVFVGRSKWPRTNGIESRRGVQIGGTGHVVCHNRISHFGDAINVTATYPTTAIDFYRNEISECTDDGIELDYSEHNTRCFDNRLTNVYHGISLQPVHGGPAYVFRNTLYNVAGSSVFKLNNSPSGCVIFHNTTVRVGMPIVYSGPSLFNSFSRNNLFIGTTGNYAFESTAKMVSCDYDYDGFGGTWGKFMKWNSVRYSTIADVRKNAPVYKNVVRIDPLKAFQSSLRAPAASATKFAVTIHDTRLSAKSAAIDAGVVLPNINDGFAGKAPDLGAHELGKPMPAYGPRPVFASVTVDDPSPRPGQKVTLTLTTEGNGNIPYQTASSLGTGPIEIDTRRIGLSVDPVFMSSVSGVHTTVFSGFAGKMRATGRATATIQLPKAPSLVGLTILSAFVTFGSQSPSGIRSISKTRSFQVASQ